MSPPALMATAEAARPKVVKPQTVLLPASSVMTFECPDCSRERFKPYEFALGAAVIAGPGNIVACSCGDGCIERPSEASRAEAPVVQSCARKLPPTRRTATPR